MCTALSQSLGEPLVGTAAVATTWLCIEQPGAWGHDALVQSQLDPELGAELADRAGGTGVRISLIRRPGRSDVAVRQRQVYLAHTQPGASWLERAAIADVKELLALDFARLGAGERPGIGRLVDEPVLLVCTNGSRDRCCAQLGRPIAGALAARHGDAVWETTHTGGHRFAPTGVVLPSGYLYGRLDVESAEQTLRAAADGAVRTGGCRGRSTWTTAGQVAELAVRDLIDEPSADALFVTGVRPGDGAEVGVEVRHVDGRRWLATVAEDTLEPARRTSCAKDAVTPTAARLVGEPVPA